MDSQIGTDQLILKSAQIIINIPNLDKDIGQFAKGIVLMLCDKFVEDESLNTTISNLVGGNMKIVEDYAQRKVDEAKEEFEESKKNIVVNLDNEGYEIKEIARIADVSMDFVNKTLAK